MQCKSETLFEQRTLKMETSSSNPVLTNLTAPPKARRHELYRWCDYIELRCLTHIDQRFSRDALAEAIDESVDTDSDVPLNDPAGDDEPDQTDAAEDGAEKNDRQEQHAAFCFKHLRWREKVFDAHWPFNIDEHAREICVKDDLTEPQRFYLSLLLSASLSYVPKTRWPVLTGLFEQASTEILKHLMPRGAEVHAFGAAQTTRYTGHLFDRLTKLTNDVRGSLDLKKTHFAEHDSGDGGLDIVAWHNLGDERKGMPIAFAQCGCTASGWPDKMLQASPARLGGHLCTLHEWATYYFMPLDLSTEIDDKMDWQGFSDFGRAIVIDRLRFIRLTAAYTIAAAPITALDHIEEARSLKLS